MPSDKNPRFIKVKKNVPDETLNKEQLKEVPGEKAVANVSNETLNKEQVKECPGCKETKPISLYYINSSNGKPAKFCKVCAIENRKKNDEKAKERNENDKEKNKNKQIICVKCDIKKPYDKFRIGRKKCGSCEKKHGRGYRKSDIGREKAQTWVKRNPIRMKQLQRDWHQRSKPKINEKYNIKYSEDINFKIKKVCSIRILGAFANGKKGKKSDKTVKYLGCKISHLMEWLEYCFKEGMTFENHGPNWHIDHVLPINHWDIGKDDQAKLCFNWTNLSPMKGSENMSKHDKINNSQVCNHMNTLLDFMRETENISIIKEVNNYVRICARYLISGNLLTASATNSTLEI